MWFLTNNFQIIDLNRMISFWIEDIEHLEQFRVFCQDQDKIEWRIAEFTQKQQAQQYIFDIHTNLVNNEKKEKLDVPF